jgi:alanyl-tRNA synthetase
MNSSLSTAADARAAFLKFFSERGHTPCASAPLVPQNDPTLMFVNAGMVPFKDVFTGKETRGFTRATSSQKCIRISGKHNDLENVGVTARHHTFFEMLGNFSFGDYFKEDAIAFAWEFLTKICDLPQEKMVITVFGGEQGFSADDDARAIWKKVSGFPDEKIIGLGMKDNFWQMGDTGPCGPCTEIHFWNGEGDADLSKFLDEPPADGKGWMEIWNLVFMQYERFRDGENKEIQQRDLPKPCVDTGMGLERIASVLQGKTSNYDTDLLRALVEKASEISGKSYRASQADDDVSMRVIADHARTTAFLIAEGVFPDRAGREYVLRRVMRRAIRHGHRLGIVQPFLHEVAAVVVEKMGDTYPELVARKDLIENVTQQEEVRFRQTIDRGLELIEKNKVWRTENDKKILPGEIAFKLYDTFGFPLDLTEVIGNEAGFTVDGEGFERAMDEQRARSEGSKVGDASIEAVWRVALEKVPGGAVRFTGYEREDGDAKVVALVQGTALVNEIDQDTQGAFIIVDATPFYGEAGGQVGDHGTISGDDFRFDVTDTQKPIAGLVVHVGAPKHGKIRVGDAVKMEVDHARRTATRRNHSATHLLHWALRKTLGEQATQKGSLVGPNRMRFDFSHGRAVTNEELRAIENLVNEKILTAAPVLTEVLPIDDAKKKGAVAIFEEKYGDVVRVLTMTKDSVELCGGTHARSLGEIGQFKIVSEGGVAAGVRRIEAATGMNALGYTQEIEDRLASVSHAVGTSPSQVSEKIDKLLAEKKQLEKDVADLKKKVAMGGGGGGGIDSWVQSARDIPGGKALAVKVDAPDAATLRDIADKIRDKLGDAVVLVAAAQGPKAALVLTVSKSLTDKFKAGELIKPVAEIVGGSGGGRPDMAQAGGTQIDKIDDALAAFYARLT